MKVTMIEIMEVIQTREVREGLEVYLFLFPQRESEIPLLIGK